MGAITTRSKKKKKSSKGFVILALAVCIIFGTVGWNFGVKLCKTLLFPNQYEDYITKYALDNELDKYLVMAVVKVESNYVPDAHSGKATGLMQLTDDTGKWVAEKLGKDYEKIDLNNPKQNVELGCFYLKYLIDHYGNTDVALAAYNGGMGNVAKWLSDKTCSYDGKTLYYIPFRETRDYVEKVNKYYNDYKRMYGEEG